VAGAATLAATVRRAVFWSSLCIAVAALLLGYRYRIADTTACPVALERLADAV
jgi:hypothetical protein